MAENAPAFPQNEFSAYTTDRTGMTLRDWFAGQALAGVVNSDIPLGANAEKWVLANARAAYAVADAMLAVRQNGEKANG